MRRLIATTAVLLLSSWPALSWATGETDTPRRYDGYQVIRLPVAGPADLEALENLGGTLWSERETGDEVDIMLPPGRLAELDPLGWQYTVWIEDVQELIDQERAATPRAWFDDYHPYTDIVGYLEQLAAAHPTLAQVVNIGLSLEERPIWALRIAAPDLPPLSPAVVYFSTVHAREWIAATVPQYLATHLLTNYGTDPQVTDLVDHVEWFLIPVGNPDGYSYCWTTERLWRKNRRDNGDGNWGVDINRNWAYGWGGEGSSKYTSAGTYRGPYPFSEPETRALRDLFLNHPNVRAQLDIHSYSQLLLWPWGFTPELPPDQAAYQAVGTPMQQLIAAVHGLTYDIGPTYSTIYPASGVSLDWTYGARGIFSMSFELRDTGQYGFVLPAAQIIPNNEEILPAVLYLTNSSPVRATQMTFPEGRPTNLVAGADAAIAVAITSGVEVLNPASATLHYRYDPAADFSAVPLVWIGGAEFRATLPGTNCDSQPQYYFSITGSAGLTTSPATAPAAVYSAGMVSGLIVFDEPLDADPGWTTEGLWAWGQPSGLGGSHGSPDPTGGHSGQNVYGYNLSGDYQNSTPERHLTSPPIDCTGQWGLHLSFWRWLGVETTPWDHAYVRISRNGVDWVTIWENASEVADDRWVLQNLDISSVADNQPVVYLRWTMGSTDSGWAYCGWNIDDLQIYATGCVGLNGDWDGDGDLDLVDWSPFADCLSGPDGGIGPGCSVFDFTSDGDVDLDDVARFGAALMTE